MLATCQYRLVHASKVLLLVVVSKQEIYGVMICPARRGGPLKSLDLRKLLNLLGFEVSASGTVLKRSYLLFSRTLTVPPHGGEKYMIIARIISQVAAQMKLYMLVA